jgi:signal transduction histidine kinase
VAYGIVRAWKGAMRVRSEVGRGTKISVLVPMLASS